MSCSELNLYNNNTLIDETDEVKLYRDIRYELNNYHKHFSQLWDSYCRRLNIVEFKPINMSVQNQTTIQSRRIELKAKKSKLVGRRKNKRKLKTKKNKRKLKT